MEHPHLSVRLASRGELGLRRVVPCSCERALVHVHGSDAQRPGYLPLQPPRHAAPGEIKEALELPRRRVEMERVQADVVADVSTRDVTAVYLCVGPAVAHVHAAVVHTLGGAPP